MDVDNEKMFCAVYEKRSEGRRSQTIIVAASLQRVKELITSLDGVGDAPEENLEKIKNPNCDEAEDDGGLSLDIKHFYGELKKYRELALISSKVDPAFAGGFFKGVIERNAIEDFSVVDEHGDVPIYEITREQERRLSRTMSRLEDIRGAAALLPSAVLISLVSSYDWLFSELTKSLLRRRPERYHNSERQYSISEILSFGSLEDVINCVIDDEVESIMNKSHVEQVKYFEKAFSVSVSDSFVQWPAYVELFERRNLAAHGRLCADQKYLDNCEACGFNLQDVRQGSALTVDAKYLRGSVDILTEFGTRLILAAWQKQVPSERAAAIETVVDISYDLLKEKRYSVAANIIDFTLSSYGKFGSDRTNKMLKINHAIAHRKMDNNEQASKILSDEDWSAVSPVFQLCAAAVDGDSAKAAVLLEPSAALKELGALEVREWPAFDWIRGDEQFQKEFNRIFAQSLTSKERVASVESAQSNDDP